MCGRKIQLQISGSIRSKRWHILRVLATIQHKKLSNKSNAMILCSAISILLGDISKMVGSSSMLSWLPFEGAFLQFCSLNLHLNTNNAVSYMYIQAAGGIVPTTPLLNMSQCYSFSEAQNSRKHLSVIILLKRIGKRNPSARNFLQFWQRFGYSK